MSKKTNVVAHALEIALSLAERAHKQTSMYSSHIDVIKAAQRLVNAGMVEEEPVGTINHYSQSSVGVSGQRMLALPHGAKLYAAPLPPVGQQEQWQPIETAPRDGSRFLGSYQGKVGFWHWQNDPESTGRPIGWRDSFIFVSREGEGPTHWMPIPEVPAK